MHRRQMEDLQLQLDRYRLENKQTKQIFAKEHNTIVNGNFPTKILLIYNRNC